MQFLEKAWYKKAGWLILLWPISALFQLLATVRRSYLVAKNRGRSISIPVVVVGNVMVGGTGKTPLIVRLGKLLQDAGYNPGVISRGYLGKAPDYPFCVNADSDVSEVGDEALLVVRSLGCPMVVDPKRDRALEKIINDFKCDVVLSDDGLQHYALPRDIEVVVVDGERLFGNGMCLPAGPLREPISRLEKVQHVIVNGESPGSDAYPVLKNATVMRLEPTFLINLLSGEKKPFRGAPFNIGATVHAVTGIGNPNRFYNLLSKLPYNIKQYDFPDHHPFTESDFVKLGIDEHQPILMTEKDAVKCLAFARPNFWYLAVKTRLPEEFEKSIVNEIRELCVKQNS